MATWRKAVRRDSLINNTIKIFEQQALDVYEYHEAINVAIDSMDAGKSQFDSAPEMALAIELISNRERVKTQVEVGGYRLDIVLPELQIVVEVDGHEHRDKIDRDATRDIIVHDRLGPEWETVHVKEHRVRGELATLLDWILKERDRIRRARDRNGGLVPYGRHGKSEVNEILNYMQKIKTAVNPKSP